jgi:hypothetical protein
LLPFKPLFKPNNYLTMNADGARDAAEISQAPEEQEEVRRRERRRGRERDERPKH